MGLSTLNEHLVELKNCHSVEEIHTLCGKFCDQFGFDAFLFALRVPTSFTNSQMIMINGYPTEWRDHYFENDYLPQDPTVAYCAKNILPLEWHSLDNKLITEKPEAPVMSEAAEFGLKDGVSMPVHSPNGEFSILSCSIDKNNIASNQHVDNASMFVQLFATHVHEAVRRAFGLVEDDESEIQLTERERECLLWAAEGKTAWETSQILNVSERTVNYHLSNSNEKLNVSNRQHAIAKAVLNGIISPYPF